MQLVMAAMATEPAARWRRSSTSMPDASTSTGVASASARACRRRSRTEPSGKCCAEAARTSAQRDPVLRPARAGEAGLDGRQVELERLVEVGSGARLAPEALLLGVGLDQRDLLGRPAGQAQVARASRRRSGRARPWPRTRATCWRSSPGRPGSGRPARRRRTRRTCRPRRGRAAARSRPARGRWPSSRSGSSPCSRTPTTLRHRLVERLAEQDGLGLDAADAVAEHAERR